MNVRLLGFRLGSLFCAAALFGCGGGNGSNATSPIVTPADGTPDPGTGGNGASDGGSTTTPPPTASGDGGSTTTTPPPATLSHRRCAWMNDNIELGKASFAANADFFDDVHPYWWTLNAAGGVNATSWPDDAQLLATAQAHHVKVMPLVYGGDDASLIRNVISSPTAIAAHVQVLVNLAVSHHYDGIELDYEHLWDGSDRPGYTALVTQLAAGLHAQGKELSLSVPAIDVDNGANGYDFAAEVAGGVDVVHLMGYDFHGISSPHQGPLAPIGWIDAVAARVEKLGLQDHFVLGIANYGVGAGWYVNSADAVSMCGAGYATTTDHMLTCSFGNYTAGVAPHCTTARGDLWFEDGASIAEKANVAKAHHLRGVSYYTLGGEAPGLFTALRAAFP